MKQLNLDQKKAESTGLSTALPSPEMVHTEKTADLTELIRSGKVTREELDAAIKQMDREQYRKKLLKRHTRAITLGKDGRWRTTIKKPDGTRQDIKKPTLAELEDFLIDFYDHEEDHKTVRDIFEDWIQKKEEYHEIKPASASRYWTDFKRFFTADDEFCKLEIIDITEADLEDFIKRQIVKNKLTRKTYAGLRILLMGIFKRARKLGLTDISICVFFEHIELSDSIFTRPVRKTDADEVFSEQEEQLLLTWLRENPSLLTLGVVLMFQTGLRVGELSTLKWDDIDLARMVITIRRTETSYSDTAGHRIIDVSEETKTEAGDRVVYLPETAKQTLRQILKLNPYGEWLFQYRNGRRMTGKAFRDQLYRGCDHVGIPRRSTHKIRKTYATVLIDGGATEKLIQRQLGHKDFSTTRRYYDRDRMSEQAKREEISRIVNM